MYSMNPGLAGALVNDHVAELRRSAARPPELTAPAAFATEEGRVVPVSLGLRLVLPRHSVLHRSVLHRSGAAGGAMTPKKPGPSPAAPDAYDHRDISDPRTMRALAHPVRLALLEALRREGPLTATRAAELLDDSPGNMSWHLQTLAKYGFVEEAGGGRGRSRPWRVVSLTVTSRGGP